MSRLRLFVALLGAVGAVLLSVAAAGGANSHANYRAVCPSPPSGYAHCHELVVTDSHGNPRATSSPTGLGPTQIASAYGWDSATLNAGSATIAIVDAYDDPSAENDLNVFSDHYNLPACTTSNGCFTKVDQTGGTHYPRTDSGWALEISLDIEWAHAIAPNAKILLVEAASNSFANLMAAEDYARGHARYVSNSWGGGEFSGESSYDSHFTASGVSVFVSAGDSGGSSAEYPSASPNVISVGGTTLHFDGSGAFAGETGWSDGGGGCSVYESATSAQASFSGYPQVGCGGKRATPDISLDADPSSGVSVYDSTRYQHQSGWFTVGGTSASSPMVAARSADAGAVVDAGYVYGNGIGVRDITSGDNGNPCLTGYDLCTGRGSWADNATQPPAQASISFTTLAQTLTVDQRSDAITIQLSPSASPATTVTVTSTSDFGSFATSQNGTYGPGPLTLSSVSSSATFYYRDSQAGSPALTASATGYADASQTETITSASGAPAAPTGLTATTQGKHIDLSWQPSSGATSYSLYRSTTSGKETLYAAGLTSTSAKDLAVSSGTTYYYKVSASGPGGESQTSDETWATAH
jgi:subtilase family serine protease